MNIQKIRLVCIFVVVALLLLIPWIAMKFTNEVKWNWFDFLVAGTLLLGTGLICELVLRTVKKIQYRLAICAVILFLLFIVWAELAVGLIGTRFAGS